MISFYFIGQLIFSSLFHFSPFSHLFTWQCSKVQLLVIFSICTHSLDDFIPEAWIFMPLACCPLPNVSPQVITLRSSPAYLMSPFGWLIDLSNLLCPRLNSLPYSTSLFNFKSFFFFLISIYGNSILPIAQSKNLGVFDTSFSIRKSYWFHLHTISWIPPLLNTSIVTILT